MPRTLIISGLLLAFVLMGTSHLAVGAPEVTKEQVTYLKPPVIEITMPKSGEKYSIAPRRQKVKGNIQVRQGEWVPATGVVEVTIAREKTLRLVDGYSTTRLAEKSKGLFSFELEIVTAKPLKSGKHYVSVRCYRQYDESAPDIMKLHPETVRSELCEIEIADTK